MQFGEAVTVRSLITTVHRWTGLCLALFLIPIGLAGTVLVWRAELDPLLNSRMFHAASESAPRLSAERLIATIESRYPTVRVRDLEFMPIRNGTARVVVAGWPKSADGRSMTEVFVDPSNGTVLGARNTRQPTLSRAELFPWLRRFHYTFMLEMNGMLALGGVAVAWAINSVIGFYLTLPPWRWWRRWKQAWLVRRAHANYDLHRASGLWLWPMLLVLACSSVYLNLTRQVFVPTLEFMTAVLPQQWEEPVASAITQWQHPLHTGDGMGLIARILISCGGVATVVLSVTGIVMWLRGSVFRSNKN